MHFFKYGVGILLLGGLLFWYYKKPTAIDQNVLHVGTNAEYQPFSFVNNNNEVVGFDIDIAKEVCNRLGKKCVLHSLSFDALIPEIQLGSVHIIAAGMTPTPARAQRVFFTKPHLSGNPLVAVTLTNNNSASYETQVTLTDFKQQTIAVNQGYTADSFVTEHFTGDIVRLAGSSVSEGLLALDSKQANVYVVAHDAIKPFFDQDTTHKYRMVPLKDSQEAYALAVSRLYPELHQQIEKTINDMKHDGTITQLIKKWNIS